MEALNKILEILTDQLYGLLDVLPSILKALVVFLIGLIACHVLTSWRVSDSLVIASVWGDTLALYQYVTKRRQGGTLSVECV